MIQITEPLITSLREVAASSKLSAAETEAVLEAAKTLSAMREILTTVAMGYAVGNDARETILRWTGRLPATTDSNFDVTQSIAPVVHSANVPWGVMRQKATSGLHQLARDQRSYFQMMLNSKDSAGMWAALLEEGFLTEHERALMLIQQSAPQWILVAAQDVIERIGKE